MIDLVLLFFLFLSLLSQDLSSPPLLALLFLNVIPSLYLPLHQPKGVGFLKSIKQLTPQYNFGKIELENSITVEMMKNGT